MSSTRVSAHCLSKLLLVMYALWLPALAKYTPYIPNSFFFSYDPPGVALPVPVTEQCQTITITWNHEAATGPSPVAPYILQIYTSSYIVPFLVTAGSGPSFQWQVPFAPGTLYQICMFDSVGNTGGCQSIYTVIAPRANNASIACTNVTFPPVLGISGKVSDGPLSQYGWVDQCTDISVTPQNGTPPYTFTIAPSLHPPYKITSNSLTAMNWTVALSWASPFFISVIDAAGNSWANGPLHSGMGTTSDCLVLSSGSRGQISRKQTLAASIGSAFGGLFLGAVVVCLFMLCWHRSERSPGDKEPPIINSQPGPVDLQTPSLYIPPAAGPHPPSEHSSGLSYQPLVTQDDDTRSRTFRGLSDLTFLSSSDPFAHHHTHARSSSHAPSTIVRDSIRQELASAVRPEGVQAPFNSGSFILEELPPSYYARNIQKAGPSDGFAKLSEGIGQQPGPS